MRAITIAVGFAIALSAAPAMAQSSGPAPAEPAPAGFEGRSFVDSRGCVFIRAGTGTNVRWVARVTRKFEQVCGFAPTFGASADGANVVVVAAPPTSVAVALATKSVVVQQPVAQAPAKVAPVKPPRGYKSAWSDGRLNPNRGPRSAAGDASMAQIWDNSVPMKRK